MEPSDSYLSQNIKSGLDKVIVLLNKIHATKDIHDLSDLKLQALSIWRNKDDIAS